VFLASRVHQLVSVEQDPTWSAQVASFLAGRAEVEMVLAPPRAARQASEMAYSSSSPAFAGQTFIDYVAVADRYPDGVFDLLVIDGRARTRVLPGEQGGPDRRRDPARRLGARIVPAGRRGGSPGRLARARPLRAEAVHVVLRECGGLPWGYSVAWMRTNARRSVRAAA
jgi:hypothetical protein